MHRSILLAATLLLLLPFTAEASSGGVTRRAQLTTAGCGAGSCHGAQPSTQTSVSLAEAVDGKLTVEPGSTTTLTLVVQHQTQAAAGTNIAVNTELNGTTPAGTLAADQASGLRALQGQLTHSTPKNLSGGEVRFEFTWTAPETEGTYYLHAVANAVNRNGVSTGDQWNWLQPIEITVSGTSSVNESIVHLGGATIAPMPAHGEVTISVPVTAGEPLSVQIMDATGAVVRVERVTSNTDHLVYVWDGRTNDGSLAGNGTYTVAVIGARSVQTGRAIIVR